MANEKIYQNDIEYTLATYGPQVQKALKTLAVERKDLKWSPRITYGDNGKIEGIELPQYQLVLLEDRVKIATNDARVRLCPDSRLEENVAIGIRMGTKVVKTGFRVGTKLVGSIADKVKKTLDEK